MHFCRDLIQESSRGKNRTEHQLPRSRRSCLDVSSSDTSPHTPNTALERELVSSAGSSVYCQLPRATPSLPVPQILATLSRSALFPRVWTFRNLSVSLSTSRLVSGSLSHPVARVRHTWLHSALKQLSGNTYEEHTPTILSHNAFFKNYAKYFAFVFYS